MNCSAKVTRLEMEEMQLKKAGGSCIRERLGKLQSRTRGHP